MVAHKRPRSDAPVAYKRPRGRPPAVTLAQLVRIEAVREARDLIPSDKELAAELGVKIHVVQRVMKRQRAERCS